MKLDLVGILLVAGGVEHVAQALGNPLLGMLGSLATPVQAVAGAAIAYVGVKELKSL